MFKIIPFQAEHLTALTNDTFNSFIPAWVETGYAKSMERPGLSGTILVKGEVTLCGGVTEYWPGRAQVWTILGESCKANFLPTFRGIKKFLDSMPYARLELCVPCGTFFFSNACRRAELLGFEMEIPQATKYLVGGGDATVFVKIQEPGKGLDHVI